MWAECEPTGNLVVFHLINKTEIRQMCKMNVHVQVWRRVTRIISQCNKYVRHFSTFGLLFIFCTFYSRLCNEMSEPIHSSHTTCICCNKCFIGQTSMHLLKSKCKCIPATQYYIFLVLYYTGLNGSPIKTLCKLFIITLPEKRSVFRCCGLSGDR